MRVHHIAFRTRDLEELERFYVDVLALRVIRKDERGVWLDAGGSIVMLERAEDGEPLVPGGTMEMIAFDVEKEARIGWLRRLAENNVPIEAQTEHTLYFRDPDGRRIGLSHYPRPPYAR
jgi:catechol-2,3-dioxygenase